MAGVVNFALRDDSEGSEVTLTHGNSSAGSDGGKYNLNWMWGREGERSHTMEVVDLFSRNAMYDRDRKLTANSVRSSQQGVYPSFTDLELMYLDQTEGPEAEGCPEGQFGSGNLGEFCEIIANVVQATQDEYESATVVATFNYDISDKLAWFNTLMIQTTESRGTSSPANFSRAPFDPESPLWPEALKADLVEEGSFHPDYPSGEFCDFYGYPIFAWGKFPDPRAVEVESESMRLVTGL